jgi:secondary thiamine-phosphate synthase enzyme
MTGRREDGKCFWATPVSYSRFVILTNQTLTVETRGQKLEDVTSRIEGVVKGSRVRNGVCTLFLRHTSASLVIQENADPAVLRDLQRWLEKLAPESKDAYEHDAEGSDDMPAHLRSAVTRSSETIPIINGALALGTWQAVYVWEHRRAPHRRELIVTVMGEEKE